MTHKPHKDRAGRLIHYCMAPGCNEWGCFGFKSGEWYCGQHRAAGDMPALQVNAAPEPMRRLL